MIQYIYLNYFSKNVIRKDKSKIIPYKHSVIDLDPLSKVIILDGDVEIGSDRLRKSKSETFLRLRQNAVWMSKGGCRFSYGTTLEILKNAHLNSCFFTMNTGSTLISAKEIQLGQDVMIARNVVIYDSDFHPIRNNLGRQTNPAKRVIIGNHVWIGTGSIILKGTEIGNDSVIAAGSRVTGKVKSGSVYRIDSSEQQGYGRWER